MAGEPERPVRPARIIETNDASDGIDAIEAVGKLAFDFAQTFIRRGGPRNCRHDASRYQAAGLVSDVAALATVGPDASRTRRAGGPDPTSA